MSKSNLTIKTMLDGLYITNMEGPTFARSIPDCVYLSVVNDTPLGSIFIGTMMGPNVMSIDMTSFCIILMASNEFIDKIESKLDGETSVLTFEFYNDELKFGYSWVVIAGKDGVVHLNIKLLDSSYKCSKYLQLDIPDWDEFRIRSYLTMNKVKGRVVLFGPILINKLCSVTDHNGNTKGIYNDPFILQTMERELEIIKTGLLTELKEEDGRLN